MNLKLIFESFFQQGYLGNYIRCNRESLPQRDPIVTTRPLITPNITLTLFVSCAHCVVFFKL